MIGLSIVFTSLAALCLASAAGAWLVEKRHEKEWNQHLYAYAPERFDDVEDRDGHA